MDIDMDDIDEDMLYSQQPRDGNSAAEATRGVKDVPSNAFDGLTMVVTGVFETISREDLVSFIKDKGGKSPSAVSGKTNYLIAGSKLEDGREVNESKKYKDAEKKGIKIYTEMDFEEFVQRKTGMKNFILGRRTEILQEIAQIESSI